ncbi:MAG: DUF6261 family protein [Dysgonamonadaceae bacterium]|jgi:hypothetical protein|nr:DUF6261 family protein [Dysgonamonadaceae bacterium]
MKITPFYLYHARNEEHYQFLANVKTLLERHPAVADIVSSLMPAFNQLLGVEKSLVDPLIKSDYTKQIAAADRRRDRALAGLSIAIRSLLHHPDPAVVDAAVSIQNLLKSFRNLIGKKACNVFVLLPNLIAS